MYMLILALESAGSLKYSFGELKQVLTNICKFESLKIETFLRDSFIFVIRFRNCLIYNFFLDIKEVSSLS